MIPLAKDTREAIGAFADKVENRSLLFEKMVLSKTWGHEARFNDANRYNVLRACSAGDTLLSEDGKSAQQKAGSPRAQAHVKREAAYRAKVAGALAGVRVDNPQLAQRQAENASQLLALIERSYKGRSHTFVGTLGGRLLINMAGGVQENAGLALDRCFGLPFLPGSAVKGVTRHTALWDIRATTDPDEKRRKLRLALLAFGFIRDDLRSSRHQTGDFAWAAGDAATVRSAGDPFTKHESFKGLLSFLPAYPTEEPTIVAEVLTPHPRAEAAARGRGEPHPIFFPAVEAGSSFGFAIVVSWAPKDLDFQPVLDQAAVWLQLALTEQGIGAKTGAGFGWFIIDPQAEERRRARMADLAAREEEERRKAAAEAAAKQAEEERLAALPKHERRAEELDRSLNETAFAEFAKDLAQMPEVDQRAFCCLLAGPHADRWKKWRKSDKWKDRVAHLRQIATRLGVSLP
ncbi:MAG: type III-B CRISPR module RAMP protein Cmr6 [Verrucomicrobiales bacterium]|nr:type III-B CRISPR module RAMP protein Cmr6 [Verrucomicrobiales bacterium]